MTTRATILGAPTIRMRSLADSVAAMRIVYGMSSGIKMIVSIQNTHGNFSF